MDDVFKSLTMTVNIPFLENVGSVCDIVVIRNIQTQREEIVN